MAPTDRTADLQRLRARVFDGQGWNKAYVEGALIHDLWAEVERLHEMLTCPRLTADAPTEQFTAVLHDFDKGRPVNGQDLVNALAWRVANQRKEIAQLHKRFREARSDAAPSFSPNFDERNGIR